MQEAEVRSGNTGVGLGFRYTINYKGKGKTLFLPRVYWKRSQGHQVCNIKVRQQETLCKDKGSADWGQAAELPHQSHLSTGQMNKHLSNKSQVVLILPSGVTSLSYCHSSDLSGCGKGAQAVLWGTCEPQPWAVSVGTGDLNRKPHS